MKNRILITLLLVGIFYISQAQDDLMQLLEANTTESANYTVQTFKGTRLINGQTIETRGKGELEFIFSHRFGALSLGSYELFGLDQAFVRYGLEYALTDRIGIGAGRNSVDKTVDGYLRYKVLRQQSGLKDVPVTITAFGYLGVRTSPRKEEASFDITLADRMAYTTQLLIARKFSSFSLQLMPTFVHKNTVDQSIENNENLILGFGGRLRVAPSVSITGEYYKRLNVNENSPYYDPLGLGVAIETGGHIFELVLTNTRGLTERAFLTETTGDLGNGDIHFGFNITRTFQLNKENR